MALFTIIFKHPTRNQLKNKRLSGFKKNQKKKSKKKIWPTQPHFFLCYANQTIFFRPKDKGLSLGALSDVTVVLGMSKSIVGTWEVYWNILNNYYVILFPQHPWTCPKGRPQWHSIRRNHLHKLKKSWCKKWNMNINFITMSKINSIKHNRYWDWRLSRDTELWRICKTDERWWNLPMSDSGQCPQIGRQHGIRNKAAIILYDVNDMLN